MHTLKRARPRFTNNTHSVDQYISATDQLNHLARLGGQHEVKFLVTKPRSRRPSLRLPYCGDDLVPRLKKSVQNCPTHKTRRTCKQHPHRNEQASTPCGPDHVTLHLPGGS